MPLARRKQIAAVAKKHNALIAEDDVYYDLRYSGKHLPVIQSFAPDNVAYLGSLSKTLAPAMRCGFAVIPHSILDKMLVLKMYIDMQTSSFTQAMATAFLQHDYQAHVDTVRAVYKKKRDIMLRELKRSMPAGFTWNEPEGGMFIWLKGPKNFDAAALLPKALDEHKVAYMPGSGFFVGKEQGLNTIRLSFSNPTTQDITEGVKRMGKLFTKELASKNN